jgi:hypothetical protein
LRIGYDTFLDKFVGFGIPAMVIEEVAIPLQAPRVRRKLPQAFDKCCLGFFLAAQVLESRCSVAPQCGAVESTAQGRLAHG